MPMMTLLLLLLLLNVFDNGPIST